MKLVYSLSISALFLACNSNTKKEVEQEPDNTERIQLEKVCLEKLFSIGEVNDIEVFEGGFSGLTYIPNSDNEFLAISDRGPNLEYKVDSIDSKIKLFLFPNYHPKIFKLKFNKEELVILDTLSIKNFDGRPLVGLPVANLSNQEKEIAWENTNGKLLKNHPNGIDAESISIDHDGNYWISDEYQTSLWKIDYKTGIVIQKFTPQNILLNEECTYSIPEVFQFRKPNRGFESVSATENGHIWSILQSPAWFPNKAAVKDGRLIRMLKLNPKTKATTTYLYEHDQEEGIRQKDWKVADMTAISNTEFLTIEHASHGEKRFMRIYKIDVSDATEIQSNQKFDNQTPEELLNANLSDKKGVKLVKKTFVMDLLENGFDAEHNKPEGITMLNDSTLVVINDNDYAIKFNSDQSSFENNEINSCLYTFTLPKSIHEY